jgi:dTDP-4-amino-4,6-dideoxygalactose transaminase
VPAYQGICPEIYREEAFIEAGFGRSAPHPVAKALGETAIMLPIHHNLSDETVARWSAALVDVLLKAGR